MCYTVIQVDTENDNSLASGTIPTEAPACHCGSALPKKMPATRLMKQGALRPAYLRLDNASCSHKRLGQETKKVLPHGGVSLKSFSFGTNMTMQVHLLDSTGSWPFCDAVHLDLLTYLSFSPHLKVKATPRPKFGC